MPTKYFCIYQKERLQASEVYAFGLWSEVMKRGTKAYLECRSEAVRIYMGAAVDICLLRLGCPKAKIFEASHLIKPIEFLIQVYILTDEFNLALDLLQRLNESIIQSNQTDSSEYGGGAFKKFLQSQYRTIELAEQEYFHAEGGKTSKFPGHSNELLNVNRPKVTLH